MILLAKLLWASSTLFIWTQTWAPARVPTSPFLEWFSRSASFSIERDKVVSKKLKMCECGCGNPTPVATMTNRKCGHIQGEQIRFIRGHHRRKPLPPISDLDTAWLAGLLEGEGSFVCGTRIRKPKTRPEWRQPYFRVQVAMVDEDVIARISKLLGASYWRKKSKKANAKGWRRMFGTQVSGPKAAALTKKINKHLGVRRRKQIDKGLELLAGSYHLRYAAHSCSLRGEPKVYRGYVMDTHTGKVIKECGHRHQKACIAEACARKIWGALRGKKIA